MSSSRLEDLAIPQPPYRMKRPVVKLAAAETFPSNTPVLPSDLMQELENSVTKPEPVPPVPIEPTPSEKAAMTRLHTKAIEEDEIRTQVKKEETAKAMPRVSPPADFHEDFDQPKETKEQEIHRLAKEALEKLNDFRNTTERRVVPEGMKGLARDRAVDAQRKLDAARTAKPTPAPGMLRKEVGDDTIRWKPGDPEYEELQRRIKETQVAPTPKVEISPPPTSQKPEQSSISKTETPSPAQETPKKEIGSDTIRWKPGDREYEEFQRKMKEMRIASAPKVEAPPPPKAEAAPTISAEAKGESPKTREEAKKFADLIEQLGPPKKVGFFERLFGKQRAAIEDFLAFTATAFANRQKKKFEQQQWKIDEHIAKAKAAASKGWLVGALSVAYHEAWIDRHKTKATKAYRGQEHWHMTRMVHEDARDGILEDLAARIDRPLSTFRGRAEHYTTALEDMDKEVVRIRKELEGRYRELTDLKTTPDRRRVLEGEIAERDRLLRELVDVMSDYGKRRGNALAKVNGQEELRDQILKYRETPARPETAPKAPEWLKPREPARRRTKKQKS